MLCTRMLCCMHVLFLRDLNPLHTSQPAAIGFCITIMSFCVSPMQLCIPRPAAVLSCRPLDVFFVLLLGPYCLVSSTSHSTQHHHWGWHLKLPVAQPDDVLTLVRSAGRGVGWGEGGEEGCQLVFMRAAGRGLFCGRWRDQSSSCVLRTGACTS
jgi:hypothetical protein